jgi:GT2 family glycosyltransferase
VRKIGGFRIGFEGSQDYDLALRFFEQIDSLEIFHIPKVLYHWRLHDDSTSRTENSKMYAYESGEKALNEHFSRIKKEAFVNIIRPGMYRLNYQLPSPEPHITIIIPTKNQVNLLRNCIKSVLEKTTYTSFDVIIIDNGSNDPESIRFLDEVEKDKRIACIKDNRPFNYSALNNLAVSAAKGKYVCLLNNDIEVINSDWLSEMVSIASQPGIGAVGAKLYFPDEHIQHAGVILGVGGVAGHAHKFFFSKAYGYFGRAALMQEMSAVTGACMVVKKSVFLEAGGLDEINLPVAFNDVDFCLKLKKNGYRNIWTPFAELLHHESVSRGSEDTIEKQMRFQKEVNYMKTKWGSILETDPAYNPNLTLISENFELAWPPRNTFSYSINQSQQTI